MQWSLVSQLSGCALARGECIPWGDDFLLLVESGAWGDEAPEFLPLVLFNSSSLWEELGAFSLAWADGGWRFLLPISEDAETFSLESVEVILLEQETVPRTAWKEWIHEAEVSHSGHEVGFPSIVINQWPPVIALHDNLWKQSTVLCTVGNDKAAAIIGSLVDWILICMLKQGTAHAGVCAHP